MTNVTDADWITDADIEAIADNDPVWAVAERIVYENHGVGNAAVIIKRYHQAGYDRAIADVVALVEAQWGHIATPELRDAIRNLAGEHRKGQP